MQNFSQFSSIFTHFLFNCLSDDWRSKTSSRVYHLGEIMNIQASFVTADHAPFRLIMDSCVATLKPDSASVPRYVFVQNHGLVKNYKEPTVMPQMKT